MGHRTVGNVGIHIWDCLGASHRRCVMPKYVITESAVWSRRVIVTADSQELAREQFNQDPDSLEFELVFDAYAEPASINIVEETC